jgi:predicted RNA-binding Zn-ribbon protein involved in translation (DUF1610 family)
MKKLIEKAQDTLVVCDSCDYSVPHTGNDLPLIMYVDEPCPKCGENLLTYKDYVQHQKLMRVIDFINRWFSWLTIFYRGEHKYIYDVHVHNGIHITNESHEEKQK